MSSDLEGAVSAPLDKQLSSSVRFKLTGSEELSSESSSIGAPDDSDQEEEEVQSTLYLHALHDSLPIKKGLSSYYAGRSKSFGNLDYVKSANDVQKSDNPFNKRRRNILAYKLSSWSSSSSSSPSKRRMMINDNNRSSFYSHRNPISMPLLPVHEHDDKVDEDEHDDYNDGGTDFLLGLNGETRFCI